VIAADDPSSPATAFERALVALVQVEYDLTLFVSGASPLSARAVTNARALCQAHLPGRHVLTIVDVHSDPALVQAAGVVAVPTLVRDRPPPRRRIVGDLSDTPGLLRALDLLPAGERAV
jgi:circadian clock protein KaiB